jgi:starvation-inducible DNA-binding protein
MNVPTSDPSIVSPAVPVTGADASPCKIVAVLQELLTQSIHLRDLYKNARWQFSGIEFRDIRQMLDDHYKAQLSVIDVLVDRIRNLGGAARVFAGDFLQRTQFGHAPRGRIAPKRLLHELLEAHESVLGAAGPNGSNEDHHWMRDLAVGQVMLTNDVQSWAINERLLRHDPQQRFLQTQASGVHGCE